MPQPLLNSHSSTSDAANHARAPSSFTATFGKVSTLSDSRARGVGASSSSSHASVYAGASGLTGARGAGASSSSASSDHVEEFSKLSIKNRTVPSAEIRAALAGRKVYRVSDLARTSRTQLDDGDRNGVSWVLVALLGEKSAMRTSTSGRGGMFQSWTLTDFTSTISLFVFGNALDAYSKIEVGSIVVVASPQLLPASERKSFAISVSQVNQLTKIGTCPDYGICRGRRKDGHRCTMVVNARSGYCQFHVAEEYKRAMVAATGNLGTGSKSGHVMNKFEYSNRQETNVSQGRYGQEVAKRVDEMASMSTIGSRPRGFASSSAGDYGAAPTAAPAGAASGSGAAAAASSHFDALLTARQKENKTVSARDIGGKYENTGVGYGDSDAFGVADPGSDGDEAYGFSSWASKKPTAPATASGSAAASTASASAKAPTATASAATARGGGSGYGSGYGAGAGSGTSAAAEAATRSDRYASLDASVARLRDKDYASSSKSSQASGPAIGLPTSALTISAGGRVTEYQQKPKPEKQKKNYSDDTSGVDAFGIDPRSRVITNPKAQQRIAAAIGDARLQGSNTSHISFGARHAAAALGNKAVMTQPAFKEDTANLLKLRRAQETRQKELLQKHQEKQGGAEGASDPLASSSRRPGFAVVGNTGKVAASASSSAGSKASAKGSGAPSSLAQAIAANNPPGIRSTIALPSSSASAVASSAVATLPSGALAAPKRGRDELSASRQDVLLSQYLEQKRARKASAQAISAGGLTALAPGTDARTASAALAASQPFGIASDNGNTSVRLRDAAPESFVARQRAAGTAGVSGKGGKVVSSDPLGSLFGGDDDSVRGSRMDHDAEAASAFASAAARLSTGPARSASEAQHATQAASAADDDGIAAAYEQLERQLDEEEEEAARQAAGASSDAEQRDNVTDDLQMDRQADETGSPTARQQQEEDDDDDEQMDAGANIAAPADGAEAQLDDDEDDSLHPQLGLGASHVGASADAPPGAAGFELGENAEAVMETGDDGLGASSGALATPADATGKQQMQQAATDQQLDADDAEDYAAIASIFDENDDGGGSGGEGDAGGTGCDRGAESASPEKMVVAPAADVAGGCELPSSSSSVPQTEQVTSPVVAKTVECSHTAAVSTPSMLVPAGSPATAAFTAELASSPAGVDAAQSPMQTPAVKAQHPTNTSAAASAMVARAPGGSTSVPSKQHLQHQHKPMGSQPGAEAKPNGTSAPVSSAFAVASSDERSSSAAVPIKKPVAVGARSHAASVMPPPRIAASASSTSSTSSSAAELTLITPLSGANPNAMPSTSKRVAQPQLPKASSSSGLSGREARHAALLAGTPALAQIPPSRPTATNVPLPAAPSSSSLKAASQPRLNDSAIDADRVGMASGQQPSQPRGSADPTPPIAAAMTSNPAHASHDLDAGAESEAPVPSQSVASTSKLMAAAAAAKIQPVRPGMPSKSSSQSSGAALSSALKPSSQLASYSQSGSIAITASTPSLGAIPANIRAGTGIGRNGKSGGNKIGLAAALGLATAPSLSAGTAGIRSMSGMTAIAARETEPRAGPGAMQTALDRARAILDQRSMYEQQGEDERLDTIMEQMDKRAYVEGLQEKMAEVTSMTVTKWYCSDCDKLYDKRPPLCLQERHNLQAKEKKQWSFKCNNCSKRIMHSHASCAVSCPKCGKGQWTAASIFSSVKEGSDHLDNIVPRALARGEEQVNSLRS